MKQAIAKLNKQQARIACLALFTWASFGPVGGISARSHKVENQPVIRVRIYNYVHIHRLDLRHAERHAAYLFARAGVRIVWAVQAQKQRAGRPQAENSLADFFVRIIPPSMAARFNYKPGELGQSLVPSGFHGPTPGGIANIFWDRVTDRSSKSGSTCSEVLGDAIAHELGHLLLGSGHSARGIMRARWKLRDLKFASRARLRFLPAQVVLLQRAARLLQNNHSLTVTAQR